MLTRSEQYSGLANGKMESNGYHNRRQIYKIINVLIYTNSICVGLNRPYYLLLSFPNHSIILPIIAIYYQVTKGEVQKKSDINFKS